jgi:hypothetical protein
MDMTLAQLRGFGAAIEREERAALVLAAMAARAAQADERGWKKIIEEWTDG